MKEPGGSLRPRVVFDELTDQNFVAFCFAELPPADETAAWQLRTMDGLGDDAEREASRRAEREVLGHAGRERLRADDTEPAVAEVLQLDRQPHPSLHQDGDAAAHRTPDGAALLDRR